MALNYANNQSLSAITALPASVSGGALTLLQTQTASSSSTISFTTGLDSTYKQYIFKFINIHGSVDNKHFYMNFSTDGGSSYGVATTTTLYRAQHDEGGSDPALEYLGGSDLDNSTSEQRIILSQGADNDQSGSGYMFLFDPSNTTFAKQFFTRTSGVWYLDYNFNIHVSGYVNTTSAVDAIQFTMSSGSIESGVIKMYGVS